MWILPLRQYSFFILFHHASHWWMPSMQFAQLPLQHHKIETRHILSCWHAVLMEDVAPPGVSQPIQVAAAKSRLEYHKFEANSKNNAHTHKHISMQLHRFRGIWKWQTCRCNVEYYLVDKLFGFAGHAKLHWRLRQLLLLCDVVVGSGPEKSDGWDVEKYAGIWHWNIWFKMSRFWPHGGVAMLPSKPAQAHNPVVIPTGVPFSDKCRCRSCRRWVSLGPLWTIRRREKHVGEAIVEPLGLYCSDGW